MDGKYRKFIYDETVVAEQEDIDKQTDFILVADAERMKDDIEQRVSDIRNMLDEISGLSEIDDIKGKVKELERDLY